MDEFGGPDKLRRQVSTGLNEARRRNAGLAHRLRSLLDDGAPLERLETALDSWDARAAALISLHLDVRTDFNSHPAAARHMLSQFALNCLLAAADGRAPTKSETARALVSLAAEESAKALEDLRGLLVDIPQAAAVLGVSEDYVQRAIEDKTLPARGPNELSLVSVLDFKSDDMERRREAVRALTAEAERLGLE